METINKQIIKSLNSENFHTWSKKQFCLFLGLKKAQFEQLVDWGKDTGKLIYIPKAQINHNLPEIGTDKNFPYLFFTDKENPGFTILKDSGRLIFYFDVIAAIGWILGGFEEYNALKRDNFGRWSKENSLLHQNGFTNAPQINLWLNFMRSYLKKRKIKTLNLWPNQKTWAVAITHDIEGLNFNFKTTLRNLFKAGVSFNLSYLRFALIKLVSTVIFTITDGWNFRQGFGDLIEVMNKLKLKPTLFMCGAGEKTDYLVYNDPDYLITDQNIKIDLELALKLGFSIGMHPVIQTAPLYDRYREQRANIGKIIKFKPISCRHHYWNISRGDTADAFLAMSRAGFKFDTSLSFYDEPNFRRSIALPFQIYHPKINRPLSIIEIPSTFMDQWSSSNPQKFIAQLDLIKDLNGVAVLDWHSNRFSHRYYKKQKDLFINTIKKLKKDKKIWITNLNEIGLWWEKRTKDLGF
jgi:hypothetical protein